MKPDISEFSYGYALTSEIIQTCGTSLAGAPLFPSLIQEGDLGYDLRLPIVGAPVFLQFKLSDHMVRSTAEGADKVPIPHYRMHLRPLKYSRQHNLLLALERRGHRVFYAAPEFHRSSDLNRAYLKGEMIQKTAFFRPHAIGHLDDSSHFVCFNAGSSHGFLCSEPISIEREAHLIVREALTGNTAKPQERDLSARDYLQKVADELIADWAEITRASYEAKKMLEEIRRTREPREYLNWVAQTLFDCVVLIRLRRKD